VFWWLRIKTQIDMINVIDNFLSEEEFKMLRDHCNDSEFKIVDAGDKKFSVINTPRFLFDRLNLDGYDIVMSFIRSAYKGFDDELRIHADNIINNEKTSLASVLYISDENITPNGTCFYKHEKYGMKLPDDCSNEEFNDLIVNDSNDETKWEKRDVVCSVPNRLLTYDSNYFHSKFPNEISDGTRIVLVCFYKVSLDTQ